MVGNPKMDPPHIKTSCGTQNKNSNPMGIGLGIDYVTWWEILKWIPPIKTQTPILRVMWDTNQTLKHKISNPMGIGLGIDYVTWWEILKWIPPTSKLHVGHKIKIPILWV